MPKRNPLCNRGGKKGTVKCGLTYGSVLYVSASHELQYHVCIHVYMYSVYMHVSSTCSSKACEPELRTGAGSERRHVGEAKFEMQRKRSKVNF